MVDVVFDIFFFVLPNLSVAFIIILFLPLTYNRKLRLYHVLQLFDGHNGSAAAIYTKENLLKNVLSAITSELNRDEWIAALPRAMVAGFVKTDKDFQQKGKKSIFDHSM